MNAEKINLSRISRPVTQGKGTLQMLVLLAGWLAMSILQIAAPLNTSAAPIGINPAIPPPAGQGPAPKYYSVANWANSKLPTIASPTVTTISPPPLSPTATTATATALVLNGKVAGVSITDPGSGYVAAPTVTITGGTTPATATATVEPVSGKIISITVTNPGNGYDAVTPVTGMRKFVDTLPGLGLGGKNNLDTYIPVAVPDTTTYLGSDYYEIAVVEFRHRFHSDLHPTVTDGAKVRAYVQLTASTNADAVALTYPDNTPILLPNNSRAYGLGAPQYLGPLIAATKDRPVRILFRNLLPKGDAGHLFIPTDVTVMGAGMGPNLNPASETNMQQPMCEGVAPTFTKPTGCFAENRATLHLHGGFSPWVSDGTAHQWTVPAGETSTDYLTGVSTQMVPDMPHPGSGAMTFFYTNQQSARLMFYHDHAWGITRLNVYAGEAAGYVITDPTEQNLIKNGTIPGPGDTIPLIIQDKTFVPPIPQIVLTDPLWDDTRWGTVGDLWYPHVYIAAQNPGDASGSNAFGRWNYGLFFHPALTVGTDVQVGEIPNPYYDNTCNQQTQWCEPPNMPGTPFTSMTMEAYHDTPVINGTAYPTITLAPKPYRLRILNAANDRFFNLSLYQAVDANGAVCTPATAVPGPSGVACTEVALNTSELLGALADPVVFPTPVIGNEGPSWIQIATESGFLANPAVIPPQPTTWVTDPTQFRAGNVDKQSLNLGPAMRADVIVDLTQYAGKTLILYNDAPAAFPARDSRVDYYTGSADNQATGGAPSTVAGYGPNTRTLMQIKVVGAPGNAFDLTKLNTAFAHAVDANNKPIGAFEESQPPIVVGQADYNTAYGTTFPANGAQNGTVQIQDGDITFGALKNPKNANGTYNGVYAGGPTLTMPLQGKAIHDEMNAAWDPIYGRMSGNLGLEAARPPAGLGQQLVLYPFINPVTEIFQGIQLPPSIEVTPIASATDGTQIWKIAHNGVDTHPLHFHMADVQVLNRVDWQNLMLKPDINELGWKETVRIDPLEDTIVAIRPFVPKLPFGVPNNMRPLNPAMAIGSTELFNNVDATGNPLTPPITNQVTNFGWEYVLHCHILSHEEMDMMRPMSLLVNTRLPAVPFASYTRNANGTVTLNWPDGTPIDYTSTASWGSPHNEIGFRIQRVDVPIGWTGSLPPMSVIANPRANTTTFTDTSIPPQGREYRYRVIAYNAAGQTYSPFLGGPMPASIPAAPSSVTATLLTGPQVSLTWKDNASNESYFIIQRMIDNNGGWTFIAQQPPGTGGNVTITDTAVTPGHVYVYRVTAVNLLGQSAFIPSNTVTLPRTPTAPSALTGTVTTGTTDTINLTWQDNATNETGFTIQRATDAAFTIGLNTSTVGAKTAAPPSPVTATQSVAPGVRYYYRVQATNLAGSSAWSNVFNIVAP